MPSLLFAPSVQTDTGSEWTRPLPMQMSKVARPHWLVSTCHGPLPGFKNGCPGSGVTGVSGEWPKNLQRHRLPPLSRPPHRFEDLLLLLSLSSRPLRLSWGRRGQWGVVDESTCILSGHLGEGGGCRRRLEPSWLIAGWQRNLYLAALLHLCPSGGKI